MEWISVETELPYKVENVLGVDNRGHIHFGYLYKVYNSTAFAITHNGKINGEITHWMPLPEPPKISHAPESKKL